MLCWSVVGMPPCMPDVGDATAAISSRDPLISLLMD